MNITDRLNASRKDAAALIELVEASQDWNDTCTMVAWGKLAGPRIEELCKRYGTQANWGRPANEAHARLVSAIAAVSK